MAKRYEAPGEPALLEGATYHALLRTARGEITVRLRPDLAPQAVHSFVFLAREGFYDGSTFHRVLPGFIAQGGDPTGGGAGGPGYRIPDELSEAPFEVGALGMANAGPDTGASQFFIVLAPAPHLNGRFTLFGVVEQGMEAALALTPRDPASREPLPAGDALESVTIVEQPGAGADSDRPAAAAAPKDAPKAAPKAIAGAAVEAIAEAPSEAAPGSASRP